MGLLQTHDATGVELVDNGAAFRSCLGGVGAKKPPDVPTDQVGTGEARSVAESSAKLADSDAPEESVPVGARRR
eukprot:1228886-Heterocapsa_arctica.AAC.1